MSDVLHEKAAEILQLEDDIAEYEKLATDAKADLRERERELADSMVAAGVPFFGYAGKRWTADAKTYVKPATGESDAVVKWIEANGGSDLVQPSMHWQRRDSFLREQFLDDDGCELPLPDALVGKVSFHTEPTVTRRKA